MLHECPGHPVHVRRPVRPGVVQEQPLATLDSGLGPEVAVGVVGRADPVLSHAPCSQKFLESSRPKLGAVITRKMLCHSEDTKVLLETLDEVTAADLVREPENLSAMTSQLLPLTSK